MASPPGHIFDGSLFVLSPSSQSDQDPSSDLSARFLRRSSRFMQANAEDSSDIKRKRKPIFDAHSNNDLEIDYDFPRLLKKGNPNGGRKSCCFVGNPVPIDEAQRRWPWRFQGKNEKNTQKDSASDDEDDILVLNVKCHYTQASILNQLFNLGDYTFVKGKKGGKNFVGKITEFFSTTDSENYFRVQWLFRAEDTIIGEHASLHDPKRLFFSDLMNDNLLDCIVSKVKVIHTSPVDFSSTKSFPPCDFFYDMEYSVHFSSFRTIGHVLTDCGILPSEKCKNSMPKNGIISTMKPIHSKPLKSELSLLDMYSGCGGMSSGLSLGAKVSGFDLVTKWSIDMNRSACDSIKLNHPETHVRNDSAEDYLAMLKEWDKLCGIHANEIVGKRTTMSRSTIRSTQNSKIKNEIPRGEYEVSKLVDVCYGDPTKSGKRGLKFQVRWVGYGPSEDTWESAEDLCNCQDRIQDFVMMGCKEKIFPRPGDVDIICGGPPCQGISGYNRHRNTDSPLDDEGNRQIVVYMDIVNFLKPKYVLMENVVDILKFCKGFLGRYAVSRLVQMNYQARLGIMAAGCYGVPQFRMRVFLWGADPETVLPQFPLPTHETIVKYGFPNEFERNVVAYDESQVRDLKKALVLGDAISDLPPVTSQATQEVMRYRMHPTSEFERFIRSSKSEMMHCTPSNKTGPRETVLCDHVPQPLSEDDQLRVPLIPKKKGANFRDLPGICIGPNNAVQRDERDQVILPSGKAMVPEFVYNFMQGKSLRPYGRLWWDEIMPTVICHPNLRCLTVLHPEQDRVLTIREMARLQGFPDYYRFSGSVLQRYRQIGNAVAVPVARALGYTLGMSIKYPESSSAVPLLTLPPDFSNSTAAQLLHSSPQVPSDSEMN